MSKLTIGLLASAVLASAAAVAVVAVSGPGNVAHNVALTAVSSTPTGSTGIGAAAGDKNAVQLAQPKAQSQAKAANGPASVRVIKSVRSVALNLPLTATNVGANVTGTIQVVDTAGGVATPVAGAAVALQQKRGTAYVTISDGITDESGLFTVAFTSTVNTTWRAQLTPDAGAKVYSAPKITTASATVTWASRPDMDLAHGVASSYSFRVNTQATTIGHLEIANSKTPTKWLALKGVVVSPTGVVVQSETFPMAGTWLLRGATAATMTNAPGYTTSLTIVVS